MDLLVPSPVYYLCMVLHEWILWTIWHAEAQAFVQGFAKSQLLGLYIVVAVISCSCQKSVTFLLIAINLDLLCHEELISISGSKTSMSIIKNLLTKYNPTLMNL